MVLLLRRALGWLLFAALAVSANAQEEQGPQPNCPHGLTANDVAASSGLDLTGKTALVTGGRSGLGYAISEALLRQNCTVVMASRNGTLNREAVARLENEIPGADVSYAIFDLENFESVRAFASSFVADHQRLDYYFGNAGQGSSSEPLTVDGYDVIFQVNYVGQVLLLELLIPLLRKSEPARVLLTGSSSHSLACGTLGLASSDQGDSEDSCFSSSEAGAMSMLPFDQAGLDAINNAFACPPLASTYPLTKYLLIQYAREVARREAAAGNQVYAFSWAPGNIRTDLNPRAACCVGPVESFGPGCRYQLPYVGPVDEDGNPDPPDPPIPNHWSSPAHGTMSAMYAALHVDPTSTTKTNTTTNAAAAGSFYATYWECEADVGYFPQGMTPEGRDMLYRLSLEWAGISKKNQTENTSTGDEPNAEDPGTDTPVSSVIGRPHHWPLHILMCFGAFVLVVYD